MPVAGAIIGGVASVGSGAIAAGGARRAATAQERAAPEAAAAQERMFERQVELQEPFRQGGLTAQAEIMRLLGLSGDANSQGYGSMARAFGREQFQEDPGYRFRQAEGIKALERSAAARGKFMSGQSMKGITRFGQDLASEEYQNAFNRYQIERAARLNPLQSIMGSGQTAANVLTGAAGQAGQAQANSIMNAGAARASGYVGSANAMAGALSGIGNAVASYPLYQAQMNYFNQGGRMGGGGYSADDLAIGPINRTPFNPYRTPPINPGY